ncbi:MAG: hypothetical protein CMF60_01405 [Magnetococcales bacterium]|nr:hypothetical protein [Magnetococcales bacterium]|tara:strand:+ start:1632 stop:2486 length:855 start_codon:yes stop_codon:yes gene_type:complete
MSPKVSINVVCYNQESFIAECLESIVTQSYKNLEVLVCDDASTDKTLEVAKEYKEKYPEIIRILPSQKNQGVCLNATKGLQAATGKYFCSFAGDDIMLPGKIETQVNALEADKSLVIAHTDAIVFDDATGKDLYNYNDDKKCPDTTLSNLLKRNFICTPSAMSKRSAMPNAYDQRVGSVSDWFILIVLLQQGNGIYINKPLIKYRRHANNLSAKSRVLTLVRESNIALDFAINELGIKDKNVYVGKLWISKAGAYRSLLAGDIKGFVKYTSIFVSSALKYLIKS